MDPFLHADGMHCNTTYDSILCWPGIPAKHVVRQHCPSMQGLDTRNYATRLCGPNGVWAGVNDRGNFSFETNGRTYYDGCFIREIKIIYETYYADKSASEVDTMTKIVQGTRLLEVIGLMFSFFSLLASIIIFSTFRILKCGRTQIHLNLFIAMFCHVCIRLIKYIDEGVAKIASNGESSPGFTSQNGVCQVLHVFVEYSTNAAFMWMFLEGFYLHGRVVMNAFKHDGMNKNYYTMGWVLPTFTVLCWGTVELVRQLENGAANRNCWIAYSFRTVYWVLEGPRIAITVCNVFFLLNVIRVLVTKLKNERNSETFKQARKAVRAAFLLLPLLGIPNIVNMAQAPNKDVIALGIWSYTAHFMTTFQGFFVAVLYCFCNNEVQNAAKRKWFNCWQRLDTNSAPQYIRRISRIAANVIERPVPTYSVDVDIRIGSAASTRRATLGTPLYDPALNRSQLSLNIHVSTHPDTPGEVPDSGRPRTATATSRASFRITGSLQRMRSFLGGDQSKTSNQEEEVRRPLCAPSPSLQSYRANIVTSPVTIHRAEVALTHASPSTHQVLTLIPENTNRPTFNPPPAYRDVIDDCLSTALKPRQLVRDETMDFIDCRESDSVDSNE